MIFPNKITIHLLNNDKVVEGLVCSIQLLTFHKNNYSLGMFKSDNSGLLFITKERIEKEIQESIDFFPMDYDDSNNNFTGYIKVIIEDIDTLNKILSSIEEFYPENIAEIQSILVGNTNDRVLTSFSHTFPIKESVELNLSKKLIQK